MAIGVGALAFGWLLGLAADSAPHGGEQPGFLVGGFAALENCLRPLSNAGGLLLLAAWPPTSRSPLMLVARTWGVGIATGSADVAISLGAGERQAHRAGWPAGLAFLRRVPHDVGLRRQRISPPALILVPTPENRPVSPGILTLADQPGGSPFLGRSPGDRCDRLESRVFGFAAKSRSEPARRLVSMDALEPKGASAFPRSNFRRRLVPVEHADLAIHRGMPHPRLVVGPTRAVYS